MKETIKAVLGTLHRWLDNTLKWVFVSSADPTKSSRAVKGLLGIVAAKLIAVAGLINYHGFDLSILNTLVDLISNVVYYVLAIVGAGVGLWGVLAKIGRTLSGQNKVFTPAP